MKIVLKLIVMVISIIFITGHGIHYIEDNVTAKAEVRNGTYIDFERLYTDKVYMLDFYTNKIDVISSKKRELSMMMVGFKTPLSFFKNNKLITQNYNTFLDGYTYRSYMKIDIKEDDYNSDNAARIEFEIVPSEKNDKVGLFLGETVNIENFLLLIYTVKVSVICFLIMACSMAIFLGIKKKNIYLVFLSAFLFSSLFYFEMGIKFSIVSMFFLTSNLFKKKEKLLYFISALILSLLITNNAYILFLLMGLSIYDTVKEYSVDCIYSLAFLSVLYAVNTFTSSYLTQALEIFYEDMYLIVITCFIFIYGGYYFVVISKKYDNNVSVDLLRGISHDFKIPLSVIKLNQEIAAEGFSTQAESNSIQVSTNNAIKDLERMIGSLTIYLSRSNYIGKKFNSSVKESFEKVEKNFKNHDKNIDFQVIYDKEDIILPIDTIWFDRLIYNLVDNAFKYSKESGEVILEYKRVRKKAIITVTDTGIGMNADELSKIFTPFYRADKSRSKSGLGLGLSVIKNIVDNLNGDIKVTSKVGEGTKVVIRIMGK